MARLIDEFGTVEDRELSLENLVPPSVGIKTDDGKARYDLLVYEFIDEMVMVLTAALKKYPPHNWQHLEEWRIEAALGRHHSALMRGELLDEEDGLSHAAHAATNLMFLDWFHRNRK